MSHPSTTRPSTTRRSTTVTALAALALSGALALSACASGGPELEATGAYVPEPVTEKMASGYVTVTNSGDEADQLTSVTSDLSDDVTLHKTVDNTMKKVDSLDIPANGELKLSRGGNHLMLMGLKRKPSKGDEVTLKLRFEHSDPITLDVPVEATNHNPDHQDHHS